MEHSVRIHWIGLVATVVIGVGLSVIVSTAMATRAYHARIKQIEREDQFVTVKGSARVPLRADTAVWSIQVTGRGATQREAFGVLDRGVTRTIAFLVGQGFAPSEITLSPIDTEEHPVFDERGRATMRVQGYTLTRTVGITTGEVDRVHRAASAVTELLQEGISVISRRPEYTSTRLAEARVGIVGLASADARARAEEIAAKAGAVVAEVRHAQQGVMQVTTPSSTEVAGYGIYDTSTIDKEVSIVMTITFGLDRPRR